MTAKPSVVQGKEAEDAGAERSYRSGSSSLCILGSFHLKYKRGSEGTWAPFFSYLRFDFLFRTEDAHVPRI